MVDNWIESKDNKKNRYFIIFYNYYGNYTSFPGSGNIVLVSNNFPSQKEILKEMNKQKEHSLTQKIISNIFEFKSKKDYLNYISE